MEAQPLLSPLLDWLLVLLSVGLPGGSGGTHDPQLLRVIPSDAVVALEWGTRTAAAPPSHRLTHFQTWMADPEIQRAVVGLAQLRERVRPYSSPVEDASLSGFRDRWPAVAEKLWNYPGCLYVAWEPDVGGKLIPRAAIVLNVGPNPEAARQQLLTVLPAWMLAEPGQTLIPNALWRFRSVGEYFIWSLGSESADRVTAALQQPANAPAANSPLMAAVQQYDVPRPGHRLWINLPIDEWRQRTPTLWDNTPLSAVAALVPSWRSLTVLGSDDSGLLSRTAWLSSPTRPVATWFTPLAADTLRTIPADADYAMSIGLSAKEIAAWCALAAAHLSPQRKDDSENWQQRLERELGLNFDDHVLPAFGSTATAYSAPSTGGPLGMSPVFSLDVRNRRQAEVVFARAMEWLMHRVGAVKSGKMTLQHEQFFDHEMVTLHGWKLGELSVSPSFCLTDKHLLITLQPQTMRSHLRFNFARTETLANRRDCQLPADARGFVFVNAPAMMPTLWPVASMLGTSALNRLQSMGVPVDVGLMPSSPAILPQTRVAFGVLRQAETALVAEMRHPLSAMAPILTTAAIAALTHDAAQHRAPALLESPSIDLGSPSGEISANDEVPSALDVIPRLPPVEPIPTTVPPTQRRVWLSGLIRAVTPDDVEATIPPSVFDRIERGPTPDEAQRREERRKARDARKKPVPR